MKQYTKAFLWIFLTGVMATPFTGCNNENTYQDNSVSDSLVVATQCDTVIFTQLNDDYESSAYELGATIDYPTAGPQPLRDSVVSFINKEMYKMFDWEDNVHIPFNTVCSWNGDSLVREYLRHYGPLYAGENGAHLLSLVLAAQTETYVTYYGEYSWCGAGCSYDYAYITFRKRDGHRIDSLITWKSLEQFVIDHPQYRNNLPLEADGIYTGLTEKGFLFSYFIIGIDQGYGDTLISYPEIYPYLTPDAKALVKEK